MTLRILTRFRAASILAEPLFFVIRRLFVSGGSALAPIMTAASGSSSQPDIFAVTVIVVALGRSLCFMAFQAAS